jgi:hypothetical protein
MRSVRYVLFAVLVFTLASCLEGVRLSTPGMESAAGVAGIYRLILYGANHQDDLETVAILDLEGDGYEMAPRAPEFNYALYTGVEARRAFEAAGHFVGSHRHFHGVLMKRVLDPSGTTIGYEVRPLYRPFVFGLADILDVDYFAKNKHEQVSRQGLACTVNHARP